MDTITLRLPTFETAEKDWAFLTALPSEHGFANPLAGCSLEEYKMIWLPALLDHHQGKHVKPGLVPESFYLAEVGDELVGLFKVRHRLNEALRRTGNGHIGYAVAKQYRGRGYGKAGLKIALEILRNRPDFIDEYIFLSCSLDNEASLRTQLACGGIVYRKDEHGYCTLFPGKEPTDMVSDDIFDPEAEAIVPLESEPGSFPRNLVVCFFHEKIQELVDEGVLQPFFTMKGENECRFYQVKGEPILVMAGLVGGALCGGFLDEAIHAGVERILFVGGAGVLKKDMAPGSLMLVSGAIREDGFSFHYAPRSRKILSNRQELQKNAKFLQQKCIPFSIVETYTTDAYYRETKTKIARAVSGGASAVEMEQASLISLALFRGVSYSAILYGGDDLSGALWDNRSWHFRGSVRKAMLEIAIDILRSES